jgi:hypothetical protein
MNRTNKKEHIKQKRQSTNIYRGEIEILKALIQKKAKIHRKSIYIK